jgi:hypothetical protein
MEKNAVNINCRINEGWRRDRVKKAIKIFCAVYGITELQLEYLIDKIEDSKGILLVHWVHGAPPTMEQERAFSLAWSLCGEPAEAVIHNGEI